ncbi:Vanillyl-alcohol oxidase [Labeo rohita]|uniref:Vanillyl-alcohol oxidase n=1 Tax=Labeo rohita TaxID=84645 RepID=A0ABQ8MZQ7_LABRO|nr:Vanillyl-alcohol oxidase [Labeo rohita]
MKDRLEQLKAVRDFFFLILKSYEFIIKQTVVWGLICYCLTSTWEVLDSVLTNWGRHCTHLRVIDLSTNVSNSFRSLFLRFNKQAKRIKNFLTAIKHVETRLALLRCESSTGSARTSTPSVSSCLVIRARSG